jgi:hypothetical protein
MSKPVNSIGNKQFHKSNYDEALKYIIPSLYFEEDYSYKQKEIDVVDQVINSHLNVVGNFSSVINVSSISGTVFSGINQPSGIAPFFIKQNDLTDISYSDFERKILIPLDFDYSDFDTSADFSQFLKTNLLPGIKLNKPTLDFLDGGTQAQNHTYLINNLSWLYFLNFSGAGLSYNPSAYVHDALIDKIYQGQPLTINEGIKGLTTYVWRNYQTCTAWHPLQILPADFRPPSFTQDDQYTSGTQQLDKLLILIDIVYSPLYLDNSDTRVKDAIDDYLENRYVIERKILTGPFVKLIKAFSFAFADYSNYVDKLEIISDLDRCPDDLLPYLADIIGWKLFGSEPDRWRLQLANAVDIYRTTGTKKSVQFAVDSVLGQDVFDVSSSIYELWESYVPFLIQYALATESRLLKNFDTWTPELSNNLGIELNSRSNMDTNVRYCVDKIIYDLVLEYRNNFIFNGKPFPIESVDFIFNYRDRDYKVPPFEEIPYYLNVQITDDMIDTIVDKLVCFGVPQSFAQKVADYIRAKILGTSEDIALKNGWLFFTSSLQYPPNWYDVIRDITNTKSEYLPLWNAKSSHFKVLLDASSFDFSKDSLEADSAETLEIAAAATREFSPAHSIPDVIATLREQDDYFATNSSAIYVGLDRLEHTQMFVPSSSVFAGFGASAIAMSSYKRGLTATSVPSFSRAGADELNDALLSPFATTAILPRRSHRRRDLKNILPRDGFYDRTGHNQPAPLNLYKRTEGQSIATTVNQPVLYLGLIPSSQQWVPVPDYNNIPAIYDKCEDLTSSNVYSGLTVSNTFPMRGWKAFSKSSIDKYLDRGQLHPFVAALHYVREQSKILEASAYYSTNTSYFIENNSWMNVLQSRANSATEYSGAFPNSYTDYVNFGFGRDFHNFYSEYTHAFIKHRVSPSILPLDGPTILSHSYGPLLYNADLSKTQLRQLITTNIASAIELTNGSGIFSNLGTTSGTYIASSILNNESGIREYRNSAVLSHIELCQVSGTSLRNSFTIFDIDESGKFGSRRNKLTHNNIIIKQNSYNGFGRIIFDISKYQCPTELYDKQYNFLSPDHEFELKFKTIISNFNGLTLGGGTIGIWIHTKPELGKIWSYLDNQGWVQHTATGLTSDTVISEYCNLVNLPQITRDPATSKFACASFLDVNNPNQENDVVASLFPEDFTNITFNFHTLNKSCEQKKITIPPSDYFTNISNNVHRLNQNYVIEIFTLPVQNDKFTLYYDFSMMDKTLNKMRKPFVDNAVCDELRVDVPKDKLLQILKYFNSINNSYAGTGINNLTGYASRDKTVTQPFYGSEGGSRINYVESPYWNSYSVTGTGLIKSLNIRN